LPPEVKGEGRELRYQVLHEDGNHGMADAPLMDAMRAGGGGSSRGGGGELDSQL